MLPANFPYVGVGWFWYLGTLIPVIGIVQAGPQALADRFTYVPMIGLFVMIAWGIPVILMQWRFRKVVLSLSTGLLLLLLMIVTNFQLKYWQNDIALFEHTLAVTSNNFTIHNNLGAVLARQGKTQEAVAHYVEALRIRPCLAEAHNNLGIALAGQGKTQEAVAHFAEALRIKPDYAEAHNNLGGSCQSGEDPGGHCPFCRSPENQARLCGGTQQTWERSWPIRGKRRKPLPISPRLYGSSQTMRRHTATLESLAGQGKTQEATAHCAEALRINPGYAEAHKNLGITLARQGKTQEAIAHFAEALRFKSDYAEAHINLELFS